ncbi:MAG: parvulin peptidyl-prolyl isomerase [Chlorobi bacterium]|nr:MAG: parvulin peptidyl-prolyl isomerase [Bacteroidota bacterium]KXK34856.1 MAG: Parvulin-like peptidyl-prolyl isomerase [Chlorobi bacterium OLB6]MBE2264997.1 peptidylprolyl isomerase [Flavobacteriales bacterium]MBL1161571.1 parvulin peptidyl-prolyl isomerase [Chlorobiota bacterium]MBW7854154.1 peptidylprolyl isomerase [Candidatus Kapabacteria bacterium]MCC6332257.1 peptidylprolyl isomerase [Ignavibacteria bacterium]
MPSGVNLFVKGLWLTCLTFAVVNPAGIRAQDALDRIVAIVGEEIILKSDIDGQVSIMAQQNPGVDKSSPNVRQFVLDQLINERLVLAAAVEDTNIAVTDEEISQRMEQQIAMMVQQFGSEQRIEQLYGMSMTRIRREFRDEIRKQLLAHKKREAMFGDVKATRNDVERFYQEYKDSLPIIPDRVDLYHIVKYVKAGEQQKKEALALALAIRDSNVRLGVEFEKLARSHSADPGSAENGGDLGSVEKGKFVPSFEAAAFALLPGQVSEPVESPFGYHIIELVSKTPTSIHCKHILIKVGQSEEDKAEIRKQLTTLKGRAENGENFEDLAKEFSEERETQGFGGAMGQLDVQRLPPDMKKVVNDLADGGISDPLPYSADPTKPGYHIIYKKRLIREHRPSLEYDYKAIEQMAVYAKKQKLEQAWVSELRKTKYWEVRD